MGVQMWCEVRRRGIRPMRLTVRNAQKERRGSTRWTASTTTLTDDDETVYFRPRRNVLRRWCLVSMSCACAETAESRINGRRPVRLESNIAACDLRWCRRARHRMLSGSRQRSRQMDTSLIDVWPQLDSSTFTQYRRLYHSTRCHGQRITRSSRSPSLQSSSPARATCGLLSAPSVVVTRVAWWRPSVKRHLLKPCQLVACVRLDSRAQHLRRRMLNMLHEARTTASPRVMITRLCLIVHFQSNNNCCPLRS